MKKIKTFEETKRVSEVKGFLGYRNQKNKKEVSPSFGDLFKTMADASMCDYPHNYPLSNLR